jgi:CTP:phosphocholine cytidylyltransferase-like protein
MANIGSSQVVPEFQVVLIVDYDDGRMFPLTEGCPKCLLPVANRRLLSFQLDMLHKSGAAGDRTML